MNQNIIYEDVRSFAEVITRALSRRLGQKCQVKLQEVIKNNGVVLQGLVILTEQINISPTIYLNSFWELYKTGTSMEEIIGNILKIYEKDSPRESVDMSFFRYFDKVQDRICYKLINKRKNELLLEQIPHVEILDLCLCFYYAYTDEVLGTGSVLIYNSHMELWKCKTRDLVRLAEINTPRLFPWELKNMREIIREYGECPVDIPMEVLSTKARIQGATCMIYPGVLSQISKQLHENLYIIPSSVHEVIILPHSEVRDPEEVQKMIREINETHLSQEEVLSDSLYFYNYLENRIDSINYPE